MSGTGLIFQQIAKVMADINAIGKDRTAPQYKFRGIDDVYNELHTHLAAHGVFTVPTVLSEASEERQSKQGTNLIYRVLKIQYRFYATDGSYFDAVVIGEGMDSGDKAANKAMSVGHKYALLQVFAIPTADAKDPENESPDVGAKRSVQAEWSAALIAFKSLGKTEAMMLAFLKKSRENVTLEDLDKLQAWYQSIRAQTDDIPFKK